MEKGVGGTTQRAPREMETAPSFQLQTGWTWAEPGGSDGKEFARNAGDPSSIPGLVRSPGEGNGNPLQSSCLENPMDRGVVGYSPWGHKESDMTE